MSNQQIHKRLSGEQVIAILENYLAQEIGAKKAMTNLGLRRSHDDYSRLLLYADLVEQENAWAHILALKSVFLRYGCPFKYYLDQHSIFRFVKNRDKNKPCNIYTKFTDDTDTQWKQVLLECQVGITYALSPQAKGKVERPYRWLQDKIVRTAAQEKITTVKDLREVLNWCEIKY